MCESVVRAARCTYVKKASVPWSADPKLACKYELGIEAFGRDRGSIYESPTVQRKRYYLYVH